MKNSELVNLAKEAMLNAYAPYSNFKVGAAVLCKSGKVFNGCNIENSSYGATMCAERVAIFKAISEGEKDLYKLAIVSVSDDYTYPCGMCLQVINELMPDGTIILSNSKSIIKEFKVEQLLPKAFTLK